VPGLTPEKFAPGTVSTEAIELNGVFTPDGREFFFTRLVDTIDTIFHSRYADGVWSWVSRLVDGAWTEARVLPPPITTAARESYPVVVADGSLYFASDRPGGQAAATCIAPSAWPTAGSPTR
jgi:hypothetical protein